MEVCICVWEGEGGGGGRMISNEYAVLRVGMVRIYVCAKGRMGRANFNNFGPAFGSVFLDRYGQVANFMTTCSFRRLSDFNRSPLLTLLNSKLFN